MVHIMSKTVKQLKIVESKRRVKRRTKKFGLDWTFLRHNINYYVMINEVA